MTNKVKLSSEHKTTLKATNLKHGQFLITCNRHQAP